MVIGPSRGAGRGPLRPTAKKVAQAKGAVQPARPVAADVLGKSGPEVDGSLAPQVANLPQDTGVTFAQWQLMALESLAQRLTAALRHN